MTVSVRWYTIVTTRMAVAVRSEAATLVDFLAELAADTDPDWLYIPPHKLLSGDMQLGEPVHIFKKAIQRVDGPHVGPAEVQVH